MVKYNALRLSNWNVGQVDVIVYILDPTDIFFRHQYLEMFFRNLIMGDPY